MQYDCRQGAGVGGGGEYSVQLGFGWTNGALLHTVSTLPHLWHQGDTEREVASIAVGSLLADQSAAGVAANKIVDSLLADQPAAGVSANKIVDSLLADQPAFGVAANKIVDSLLADQPATGVTANKIVDSLLSD